MTMTQPAPLKPCPVETLFEDEDGRAFWWQQCSKPGCQNHRTHDSDSYCYPHSRWYRALKVYWNRFLSLFDGDPK